MELERKRRIHIQELNNKINTLEKFKTRQEETLKHIQKLSINENDKNEKRKEVENIIKEKQIEIDFYKKEIENTENNFNDEKINLSYKKIEEKEPKKEIKQETKEVLPKNKYNNQKAFNRKDNENIPEYVITNSYKYYNKIIETFPSYLQTKLDYMPNNKGYIFRGCWFFGKQPEDGTALTMFEKHKDVLRIHEYTQREYKLYEKIGNNYKKLIFTCLRKPKKLSKY
jgi:hypothetical protein